MTIGERLKDLRERKGVKQIDVAIAVGISDTMISSYEKDKKKPGRETLTKLAKYFSVETDYILGTGELDEKDKKDIARSLEEIMNNLNNEGAIAYGGDIHPSDAALYKAAINNVLEMIKIRNKEKSSNK